MQALSPMLTLSKGSPELTLSRSTWQYPKVDLVQNWAKLALSEGGFKSELSKLTISKGGSGQKLGKAGTIEHVGII